MSSPPTIRHKKLLYSNHRQLVKPGKIGGVPSKGIRMKIKDLIGTVGLTGRRFRVLFLIMGSLLGGIYDRLVLKEERKQCPMCGSFPALFLPMGEKLRANARCPRCGSLERHRLMYLYFRQETNIFTDPVKLLHFAPEACFVDVFSGQSNIDYLPVDIDGSNPFIKEQVDIQDIRYPDNSFDVVYCSHVLEHVPDDRKALLELYRVLKTGGWAILQVPINAGSETTLEDPGINTPELRSRFYGQHDHVRYYGLNYAQRLQEAGFNVKVDAFLRNFDSRARNRYGLPQTEDIYYCTK